MSPACLFHWKMPEKCRRDQTQSVSGGWCWDYTSAVLGAASEALWKKEESSSWLRRPFQLCIALRSWACAWRCLWPSGRRWNRDAGWCSAALVLWLTKGATENGQHGMGGWMCSTHVQRSCRTILLLLLARDCLILWLKHCTWSLEDSDLFHDVSILQCKGMFYSPSCVGCWGTAQVQSNLV